MSIFRPGRLVKFCALSALAAVAGCGDGERDQGRVQSEWALTFRQLGIVPTFPPREDFQVGDIYVTHEDPNSERIEKIFLSKWEDLDEDDKRIRRQIGMYPRLMHLDVRTELSDQYETRLSAPSSGFDANRLEDVPAIAVATAAVSTADSAVKDAQGKIDKATTDIAKAQKNIDDATAAVATAKTKLERDTADQTAAAKLGGDLTAARTAQDNARTAAAGAAKLVEDKKKAIADAEKETPPDPAKIAKLKAELVVLESNQKVADAQLDAATQAVDASVAALPAIEATRAEAEKSKKGVRDAEDALDGAKKTNTPKITELQAEVVKLTAQLAELKTKQTAAKATYDGLVAAAKLLSLGQPAYAKRNVYSGKTLPDDFGQFKNPDSVTRLRLVAFPDFITASFTGADAAAMIPLEAANLGIGLSSQDVESVSVKVPAAESYALSVSRMTRRVYVQPGEPGVEGEIHPEIAAALKNYPDAFGTGIAPLVADLSLDPSIAAEQKKEAAAKEPKNLYLTVVCEVFYARSLDVAVNYNSAGAARVTASLPATTQPAGAPVGATDSLQSVINNVQARVGQTQVVPGGSIQIVSGNSFGVGLRRTFDRPVAIGYRGFVVAVPRDKIKEVSPTRPSVGAAGSSFSGGIGTLNKDLLGPEKPKSQTPAVPPAVPPATPRGGTNGAQLPAPPVPQPPVPQPPVPQPPVPQPPAQ